MVPGGAGRNIAFSSVQQQRGIFCLTFPPVSGLNFSNLMPFCSTSHGLPEKTFITNTEPRVADYINYFSEHDFDPDAASLDQ